MIAPTQAELLIAAGLGFRPNGSTMSPDHICGVQIGWSPKRRRDPWTIATSVYKFPANRHDFRYFVGGGQGARAAADAEFWTWLTWEVTHSPDLWEPRLIWEPIAIYICGIYHQAVRDLGDRHFRHLAESHQDWLHQAAKLVPKSVLA